MAVDTSLKPLPVDRFGIAEARHLAHRAGFGASPSEVAALREGGRDRAVQHLLDYHKIEASNLKSFDVGPDLVPFLSKKERKRFRQAKKQGNSKVVKKLRDERQNSRKQDRHKFQQLQQWWLQRMADTPRPMQEKLTLLWHDHFATAYQKVKDTYLMHKQNQMFRRHAAGHFGKLVQGVIHDPAMLQYLDNQRNRKKHPNENLGRELLELFTLGEGNYTERDIKAASRALTGYAFSDNEFDFRKWAHDKGKKQILGQTGTFDGDDLVRILLHRKACSEFVAYKLYQHFVADIADEPSQMPTWAVRVIQQLGSELRRNEYQLRPVLDTLLKSRHFYDNRIVGQKIKTPAQLVVGTIRSLHTPMRQGKWLMRGMRWMGQELFEPPNVSGWKQGKAWINTSTLFVRQNIAAYLLTGEYRGQRRVPKNEEAFDPTPLLERCDSREPTKVTHFLLDALVGQHVPPERREPIVQLAKDQGDELNAESLSKLLVLITAMPEYQLC
jgi:uncharacterized protein (DUF1800 family)